MDNPFEMILQELRDIKSLVVEQQTTTQVNNQAPEIKEQDQQFTPKQLAEYWHCHVETIRLKKRNGELPFHQHGRKIIFKKSEIDALTANPVFKSGL